MQTIWAYTPTTLKFSATEVTHSRSYLLEELIIIRIFAHIKEGEGDMPETFTANRSWFNIFKNSTSLHSTHIIGEAACADTAHAFPAILKASTKWGSYPPELVLNVHETCLFLVKDAFIYFYLPQRKTCIWVQSWKGQFNSLAREHCDFKLKPMPVYHSWTP